MKYFPLLLFVSIFVLVYSLIGPLPNLGKARDGIRDYGPSLAGAVIFLLLGRIIFGTILAGMFWAVLGWLLPAWIKDWIEARKKKKLRMMVKSFVAAASGLYGAHQTTPEVIRSCANQFPEPFQSEFQSMLGMRNLFEKSAYPEMFRNMAQKYGLPEFDAVAAVVEASEKSGGPLMAARGLKRLSKGLRQRDRLLQERRKNTYESLLAAIVVLSILGIGLVLDVTVLKSFFQEGPGKLILALSSGLIVVMIVITVKTTSSKDLT